MNILIADDRPANLKLLRVQLEAEGMTVHEAGDGVEALAVLVRAPVDAVISDILMPRMDGYSLCNAIRASEQWHSLPVIIYTATYTSPGDEKLAHDVGADCYLSKPATAEMPLAALREATRPGAAQARQRRAPLAEPAVLREYNERLVAKLEQKNTELEVALALLQSKEEQLLHGQRMEAIGLLASGVAHDLNNILAPMLMVAGILKMRDGNSPVETEMLSTIEKCGHRGAGLISQLLGFGRGVSGERMAMQFQHLVRDTAAIIGETFPRNIALVQSVPEHWLVEADPVQMHQVIMNLCVNARDAMPRGGTLTLEVANLNVERGAAAGPGPGRYVVLTVKDTGQGIPVEIRDRIFEPFFTTKEAGKGTGLGLSTVMSIVKRHGGFVEVESEPGQGTAFRVYLPAAENSRPAGTVENGGLVARGGEELILVVDDEEPIRKLTQSLLKKLGYRVLVAGSGEEAVKVFIEHQTEIQVVVTDIMMTGMDGLALVRALRVVNPGIRLIAISGLDQASLGREFTSLGGIDLLRKPFTPEELGKAVSTLLARKA